MASPHAAEKAKVLFQVKHCQTTFPDTPLAPALVVAVVNQIYFFCLMQIDANVRQGSVGP